MKLYLAFVALAIILIACQPSPCEGPDKDTCLLQAAQERNESKLCSDIGTESIRTWCYTDLALKLNDTRLCANTADERSTAFCVSNIAIKQQDIPLCSAIAVGVARDKCLYEIGRETANATLCSRISQASYGDDCVYDISLDGSRGADCSLIRDGATMNRCIMLIAGRTADHALCENATGDYRDWCIANVAIKLGNSTLCGLIPPGSIKGGCIQGTSK